MSSGITESLLEDVWYQTASDGQRFWKATESTGDRPVCREQALIRILYDQIADVVRAREQRDPNYEDLYACLTQVLQFGSGYNPNPLTANSVARLRDASAHIHSTMREATDDQFHVLARKACDLIEWTVYHALVGVTTPVGLDLITECVRRLGHVDIVTLNHDLLVERQLAGSGIHCSDGFGAEEAGVSPFTGNWARGQAPSCRLFKLHGSINWRREEEGAKRYVKVDGDPDDDANLAQGIRVALLPAVLVGTAEKELRYGTDIHGAVFRAVYDALQEHHVLICSGYGWRDNGINKRILEWLAVRKENLIVLLHNGSLDAFSTSYLWRNYGHDVLKERVRHIRRWLGQVDFQCIEAYLQG